MYALPQDVSLTLGRPLTETEAQQAQAWIAQAERIIASRADLAKIDAELLRSVLAEAVARRVRNPEAISRREVQIDDGRISTTSRNASGLIEILPAEWRLLGVREKRRAFTVRPALR